METPGQTETSAQQPKHSRTTSLPNRLLRGGREDADSSYRHIIDLFLQGISQHALEGDQSDFERFRADIDQFASKLTLDTPMSEVHLIAGGALRALEEYNRSTSKFVNRRNSELEAIIAMLAQTVITIGAASETSSAKLQEIEKAIAGVRRGDDIQLLKLRLGECLGAIQEEGQRRKVEAQESLAKLQHELSADRERLASIDSQPTLDSATRLPNKKQAEKGIQAAVDSPNGKFLVVAVVNRLQAVNARFGYGIGDRVLAVCAEHFRRNMTGEDQLYRWHGPALLAILSRHDRLDQVRAQVRWFADAKLDKTVEVADRTLLIPISINWSVFAVVPPMEEMLMKIDTFTAAQLPRDYV